MNITPEMIINQEKADCNNCKFGSFLGSRKSWDWCQHTNIKYNNEYYAAYMLNYLATGSRLSAISKKDRNPNGYCILFQPTIFSRIKKLFMRKNLK